jgi:hypothetical protein
MHTWDVQLLEVHCDAIYRIVHTVIPSRRNTVVFKRCVALHITGQILPVVAE